MELWPQPSPLTTRISQSCCSGICVPKGIAKEAHCEHKNATEGTCVAFQPPTFHLDLII